MEVQEGFKPFLVTERSDKLDISSLSHDEMLTYAIKNGIINVSHMQQIVEMDVRRKILEKHQYSIYEGKDHKWYTYIVYDDGTRKKIKRNTQKEVEDIVYQFLKEKEDNPTIEEIFYRWLDKKIERTEISKSTYERYIQQYNQSLSEFGNKKIKEVLENEIEDFILDAIYQGRLSPKGYANMRTLIYGIFKYAKKKKYINFSITEVIGDIEIPRKIFKKERKSVEELIFNEEELPKITSYLEENQDIINLGILLLFKTGMRIGELVALKREDVKNNTINVNRTEIRYRGDDNKYIYEVRDFPKTEAGIRDIALSDGGIKILKKIQSYNPFGEYVFEKKGERIKTYSIRKRLQVICKKLNIVCKSPNKIRKTYSSILLDNGVAESIIISQLGHTNIGTTKGHYYKDRSTEQQKIEIINSIAYL